ncbi:MAG: murein biosynthesis integral membrane protein MurJ [Gammaproteobacteria bacterium]
MSRSLLRSSAVVGAMTLLSRLTGFARDIVIAHTFGAGAAADAFFVAFRIPNLFRRLFAEGSFAQAFVPVLTDYKEHRERHETQALLDATSGVLGTALLLVTIAGIAFAPLFILLFAPGFHGATEKYDLAVQMLRITFPYLLFISLAGLIGSVLNVHGRFGVPAFTPVLLNLSMIGAAIVLAPRMHEPVAALAWGVFAGGVLQLAFQLPAALRLGLLPRPRWRPSHPGVRQIFGLMLPSLFGASVAQINILLNTVIASFLVTGSVSWLYYSDRLVELPLGIFSVTLATVILPQLSARHARDSMDGFSATLDWALRCAVVVAVPASLALVLLAEPILCTLFQYGRMTPHDVAMSALALRPYALGLIGFTLVKILSPAFFARKDTRTPVRTGVIAVGANMILSLILVWPFQHAGLAAASATASMINAAQLFARLRRDAIYVPGRGWGALLRQSAIANLAMAAVLVAGVPDLAAWVGWSAAERAVRLAIWVTAGLAVYMASLWAAGLRPSQLRAPA